MANTVVDSQPAPADNAVGGAQQEAAAPKSEKANLYAEARKLVYANAQVYVKRLAEAVAVASVSTDLQKRDSCFAMADLLNRWIEELGGRAEKVVVGFQEVDDDERYDLPPVIFAEFRSGPVRNSKPTVLVYGHYDVADVNTSEWESDPFTLDERDEMLFARGASSGKGPILAWLWAVELFRELSIDLPVNLKFCLQGMHESESECLQDLLERETKGRESFLSDVDYTVVTSGLWLTSHKPCVIYGVRGVASFQCDVRAGSKPLSSVEYGGCVAEAMTDLIQLLAAVSKGGHGDVGIEGCDRASAGEPSAEELAMYKGIHFDMDDFRKASGNAPRLMGDDTSSVLKNRWRYPALSIHGVEVGTSDGNGKSDTIANSASGKFSIRTVPGQSGEDVEEAVSKVLRERFEELGSGNELTITTSTSEAWLGKASSALYQAGSSAILKVHGVKPDYIRDGGSTAVMSLLDKALGGEIMMLPLGSNDDCVGSANEKMGRKNYLHGILVLFGLLTEVERVHTDLVSKTVVRRGAFGRLKTIFYGLA